MTGRAPDCAPPASSASATSCPTASSATRRSPSASASTRTGSSAARASASAATPRQDERTTDLALAAARRALTDADTRPAEIDLVLVATMTPDELTPNTAPLLAHALGIGVGAYDVGAACTGWLSALSAGAAQVETGRADRVLVVGAEILSRIVDPGGQAHRDALRRRRRRRRARPRRRRRDRPDPPRVRRRDERDDHRHPRRAAAPHGRPHDLQQGRQGPLGLDGGRRRPRRPRASTRSTSSSTTRPTAASCAPSPRSSSSRPSASPTTSARRATRPPPRSR